LRYALPVAHGRQTSLAFDSPRAQHVELGEDCSIALQPGFLASAEERALMDALVAELPWLQELYTRGGTTIPAPRLTSFHGDPGYAYTYSGIRYEPAPWPERLLALRARVCEASGCAFNCVLANYYRDGRDSLGYHADDEPELGPSRNDIAIASVSLGARRRFVLKHRKDGRRLQYELGHGDLLTMRGRTQARWLHALPKTRLPVGARVNLTFRVLTRSL
jgi:alkylated DNA repair dioxygenase AlkB